MLPLREPVGEEGGVFHIPVLQRLTMCGQELCWQGLVCLEEDQLGGEPLEHLEVLTPSSRESYMDEPGYQCVCISQQ